MPPLVEDIDRIERRSRWCAYAAVHSYIGKFLLHIEPIALTIGHNIESLSTLCTISLMRLDKSSEINSTSRFHLNAVLLCVNAPQSIFLGRFVVEQSFI